MVLTTIADKEQCGTLICNQRIRAWDARITFKLSYRTVNRYARMVRMAIPFRSLDGRPRALLDTDVKDLAEFLIENPNTTIRELKSKIKERHKINYNRLHPAPNNNVNDHSKLSERTIGRYITLINNMKNAFMQPSPENSNRT